MSNYTSNSLIDRKINRFQRLFQNTYLHDYYGIKNNKNTQLKIIYFRKEPNKIELHISFEKSYKLDFIDLPEEISRYISDYLYVCINIPLEILFPLSYPFTPPLWSLIKVEHNLYNPPINLEDYYKYIVDNHNSPYSDDRWSPAIEIEVDILDFICKVNHFEYLF